MLHQFISESSVDAEDCYDSEYQSGRRNPRLLKTLILSNFVDIDEETICFWIKTAFNVWPYSVQICADEQEAIVKIPESCELGKVA